MLENDIPMASNILAMKDFGDPHNFSAVSPQLKASSEHLKEIMKKYLNAKINIGGHSLGGMDAQYAVVDITAYGARHTYGSVKVQEGVPLEVLAKWFGHKDTSMLRSIYIYIYWTRQKMSGLKEKNYLVGKLIFDKLKSPINKAFFHFCTMPPTTISYKFL
ncbi:TPA: hypothetical protein U4T24_000204 [Streptococcus agalactiae]|nr:hypothetical protein [Streptococcus agalactiae]